MKNTKLISKYALCAGEPPAVMQPFTSSVTPHIGFFDTVNPVLIYRGQNKNRGNQQSNLLSVSAGNDLRVSTMRPDLSAGIEARRSGTTKVGRGFLQLISQTN